ncbi:trimeric intracellular cation channel family protein [Pseudomonas saliphila]|uniref:trimeric intracellular cation channel family protein n=1 Tax=Pseudomonas saliphila TaxID=2586906 RepID=UPI00123926B2|nr:trimeric intracellular cation channel family protein [Pseudomonas saliphila]
MTWFYAFDLFGVAVFAITGALMAGRKSMDLLGVLVIAVITSLGGGTLRDVILDRHPVVWIRDDTYIVVAIVAALATVLWVRLTRPIHETGLLVADAFGLAVFTVIGTQVAIAVDVPLSAAVIMGVMTGVAGGVLRDIICNEIPLIFQKEIYATASIVGSLLYILLSRMNAPAGLDVTLAMLSVLVIRLAAIRWQLQLPRFHLLDRD